MATVPMDERKVARCRELAAEIADDVQRYIDAHTTRRRRADDPARATASRASTTRACRSSTPPSTATARRACSGAASRFFLGRALLAGAKTVQDAAERLAFGARDRPRRRRPGARRGARGARARTPTAALARIDRRARRARGAQGAASPPGADAAQVRHRRHRQHLRRRRPGQGRRAPRAPTSSRSSARRRSRSSTTSRTARPPRATAARSRRRRTSASSAARSTRRPRSTAATSSQTNYSSGLCMAEIAWMAAVERLDMLLNDAMYGILFRDINMCRTFVDQYVSRRFIARARDRHQHRRGQLPDDGRRGGEGAHRARRASSSTRRSPCAPACARSRWASATPTRSTRGSRTRFLLELAQAQLVRQIFDRHPIKWMPPTKHKTGDIFFAHVHDAMFDLVGVTTNQSIELLGMFSEAIHNPLLMDRYLVAQGHAVRLSARRSTSATRSSSSPTASSRARAVQVLDEALALLEEVRARHASGRPSARGAFADVKRTRTGGKGYAGVLERAKDYVNPMLDGARAEGAGERREHERPEHRSSSHCRAPHSPAQAAPRLRRPRGRRHGAAVVRAAAAPQRVAPARRPSSSPRCTGCSEPIVATMEAVRRGVLVLRRLRPLEARGRRPRPSTCPRCGPRRSRARRSSTASRRASGARSSSSGACTGSDAHTVGIDAILNYKGYAGDWYQYRALMPVTPGGLRHRQHQQTAEGLLRLDRTVGRRRAARLAQQHGQSRTLGP